LIDPGEKACTPFFWDAMKDIAKFVFAGALPGFILGGVRGAGVGGLVGLFASVIEIQSKKDFGAIGNGKRRYIR
jgi:hypothetical protein